MLSPPERVPISSATEGSFSDDLGKELGFLLREQRRLSGADDRERELNIYRSGSAPPLANNCSSTSGFFQEEPGPFYAENSSNRSVLEEELNSGPTSLSYYCANLTLNPRLPPPPRSLSQIFQGGNSLLGDIGDKRKSIATGNGNGWARPPISGAPPCGTRLLPTSTPPGFSSFKEHAAKSDWGDDGLIGLSGGSKQKSIAEILQDDIWKPTTTRHVGLSSSDALLLDSVNHVSSLVPNAQRFSYTYAAAVGSNSMDAQQVLPPYPPLFELHQPTRNSRMPVRRCVSFNSINENPFPAADFGFSVEREYRRAAAAASVYADSLNPSLSPYMTWRLENSGGITAAPSPWHHPGVKSSSLLEEFKSNKASKCFELSEISGHVIEFSADQYGSRFIQQKLETSSVMERNMVFEEITPHALSLMTDVFGNYVVQKLFEHGGSSQRRELADKLKSHVLSLSLQMYGCRVIQKAIEVVDVDQKVSMVGELEGQVMRCVLDQNGNHVIQKCIECVPEPSIGFIVTAFFGQVASLSTHPYGCRVIQRVLERCIDSQTQDQVMDEILASVCVLAQDQYGNYVIQHVLEHGSAAERSAIVRELAGKIVPMSQQKFASNVVEKCLAFGDPLERKLMIAEILGSTDENEPLQAMMKDQFANYVVQKVLETCEDAERELILSRIKLHLDALKKYTYGKHIVARIEKLVVAGERRTASHLVVA